MHLNWLDWGIVIVIVVSTIAALGRGIVVEVLSLLGLIAGIVLAGRYYGQLAAHLVRLLHSVRMSEMAAFLLIVVVTLLVATWFGHLVHRAAKYTGMGWLDSLLGAVFGLVRGAAAVMVALIAVAAFMPNTTWTAQSQLAPYFLMAGRQVAKLTPVGLQERVDHGIWTLKQLSVVKQWK
jgi:membrane protein required for colicin V production